MQEYSRRGRYRLLFPALDDDYSKFLDSPMTLHDQAFNRYLKSISTAISQSKTVAIFDTMVVCVYREHCNHNGDCVNGKCLCDEKYEGTTCYIPKDMERQQREREEKAKKTSWKDRVVNKIWHKTTQPPVQHRSRVGPNGEPLQETTKDDVEPDSVENFSGTKLLMGLFSLTLFLFVASRIFLLLSNNPHNLADNERKRS
jgi:hypothetical protein